MMAAMFLASLDEAVGEILGVVITGSGTYDDIHLLS